MIDKDLLKLRESGQLSNLYRRGFINSSVIRSIDIASQVEMYQQTGMKKTKAALKVANDLKVSRATIFNALKRCV